MSFLKALKTRLAEDAAAKAEYEAAPVRTRLEAQEGETQHGEASKLTLRDAATNRVVRSTTDVYPDQNRTSAFSGPIKAREKTWRAQLRELTGNGQRLFQTLYNLSEGQPIVHRLPDGRTSEPIVPSPEVMRGAATDLLHMLHGKPVAQTEVTKAEEDAGRMLQVQAMSDEELLRIIEGGEVVDAEAVVVERRLAKPEAEGSNPSDRSETEEET